MTDISKKAQKTQLRSGHAQGHTGALAASTISWVRS